MRNKIIILDTETTDVLEKPGMIQLGYIVCDLNFKEIKRENIFFDTAIDISFGSMTVHHITQEILAHKLDKADKTEEEYRAMIDEDFKDAFLVAHNSPFDKNVLDCNGIITEEDSWIDSYNIAYSRYQEDTMKHNLQYLRYYMGLKFEEVIDAHDALSDVIVLKGVFERTFGEYKDEAGVAGYEPENNELLVDMVKETKKGIILRKWAFGKYKGKSFADTIKTDRQYFSWMYGEKLRDGNNKDAVFNTLKFYLNENS